MHPSTFNALGNSVFGFGFLSNPTRIDKMLFLGNPVFGFQKSPNGRVVAKPLLAAAHSPVSAFPAPVFGQAAPGSAWERWEDRGHGGPPRPVVPEPSAYGALLLALVVAVVVARRVSSLRSVGPR